MGESTLVTSRKRTRDEISPDNGVSYARVIRSFGVIRFGLLLLAHAAFMIWHTVLTSIYVFDAVAAYGHATHLRTPGFNGKDTSSEVIAGVALIGVIVGYAAISIVVVFIGMTAYAKCRGFGYLHPREFAQMWIFIGFWTLMGLFIGGLLGVIGFAHAFSDTRCPLDARDVTCIWDRESWVSIGFVGCIVTLSAFFVIPIVTLCVAGRCLHHTREWYASWYAPSEEEESEA